MSQQWNTSRSRCPPELKTSPDQLLTVGQELQVVHRTFLGCPLDGRLGGCCRAAAVKEQLLTLDQCDINQINAEPCFLMKV